MASDMKMAMIARLILGWRRLLVLLQQSKPSSPRSCENRRLSASTTRNM